MAVSRRQSPDERKSFQELIAKFGEELGPRLRGDGRREDALRLPVNALITRLGQQLGWQLVIHDEVTLSDLRSRPDIAVDARSGRIGYIELKAPGKGTPETWHPDRHDREQWEKLKILPNLIYTDGSSWALYRKGVLTGRVGTLLGDLARAGSRLVVADDSLRQLLATFLEWRPDKPKTLRAVVAEVAPLCRLLRDQVIETIDYERKRPGKQPFTKLAIEWRNILFPVAFVTQKETGSDAVDFADSYAQAVTFALLLARVDGISFDGRTPAAIAEQLAKQHSLLGEALSILANSKWVGHLNVVDTIIRVIGNIDWSNVRQESSDTYSQLYETFLADYDPELRRRSGTYYTPVPVARAMVRFVDEILKEKVRKRRGFAADDVFVVDPAMGAGTFLVEVLENASETLRKERRSSAVPASHLRELFGRRLVGFELQAAPFAVAELRLHAALKNRYHVELPREEPRFLTNALDNPDDIPLDFGQLYDVLKESRERANQIKRDVPVMVVIGNPPWRERAHGAAPWLEESRRRSRLLDTASRPSMDEFRVPGQGRRAFNLSNMWTYFWRWAIWKAFEANDPVGVIALLTPSAYLSSSSYAGMRRYLRQQADEGWIIDLSPEYHRANVNTRIFPMMQHPICIGIFVCSGRPQPDVPATVHYLAISGSQRDKFQQLAEVGLYASTWRKCVTSWDGAFRPTENMWESYPLLGDLLPWQQPGVTSNRNWVWAPDPDTLVRRWRRLTHADRKEKALLFKETRDRKVNLHYPARPGVPSGDVSIEKERAEKPPLTRVMFRSLDRQYLVRDRRVVDFPRSELWQVSSSRQIYTCEQHSHSFDKGAALTFSTLVPNVDCFMGRGGRVIPLFRSPDSTTANCAPRLLHVLTRLIGAEINAEDLLAYIAALVAHAGYTDRFRSQLKTPGIRVPITLDHALWNRTVSVGQNLLWLLTFGERYVDEAAGRPPGPPRPGEDERARYVSPVPSAEDEIPNFMKYEEDTYTLVLGHDSSFSPPGRVRPILPKVWDYRTGGMQVVKKWLSYRRASPKYRKCTSELDEINPSRWTSEFDDELLELLDVLHLCVKLEPAQAELLHCVCAGPLMTVADLERERILPIASASRKPPRLDPGLFTSP